MKEEFLSLGDFVPQSMLVTEEHLVEKAKFPAIDAHNHLGSAFWYFEDVKKLVDLMDYCNIKTIVNLDGGWGDKLKESIEHYKESYPDRFAILANIDWDWALEGDVGERAAAQVEESVKAGAQGLKIFKNLGLTVRDREGKLLRPDEERLSPLWAKLAELGVPVLFHIADPMAFFRPVDRFNERWEELHAHPDWSFYGPEFPSFQELMEQQEHLVAQNPSTTFISAHVGSSAENLKFASRLLEAYPNYYVDISERIGELGRQPYSSRRFFLEHKDKILFGTDRPPALGWYGKYFRFLETADEHFDYGIEETPRQGRWRIYGIFLPDEVLEAVYYLNAERVFPGMN